MVSQLSARLLSGYASSNSSSCGGGGSSSASLWSSTAPADSSTSASHLASSIRGTMARPHPSTVTPSTDSSSKANNSSHINNNNNNINNNTPPNSIDLSNRSSYKRHAQSLKSSASLDHHHHAYAAPTEDTKRRKLEAIYDATLVQADLARASRPYPVLNTLRPRVLLDCVNLTSVELVSAKEFDKQHDHHHHHDNANFGYKTQTIMESSIVNLIHDCRSFYSLPSRRVKRDDAAVPDNESSTSSMTDTESLEQPVDGAAEDNNDTSPRNTPYISMGDALSIVAQPRLVALASFPFLVVHVNAAFTRLTGLSSVCVLGKPLLDLIVAEDTRDTKLTNVTALLHANATTMDHLVHMDERQRLWNFRSTNNNSTDNKPTAATTCRVTISPVGQDAQLITHFALDLKNTSASNNSAANETESSAPNRSCRVSLAAAVRAMA